MKRSLKFIAKFFVFVFLISYVYAGIEAVSLLVKKELNSRQGIEALAPLIDKSIAANTTSEVTDWVRLRPLDETEKIARIITPKSGELPTSLFFELARRELAQKKPEEALFWSQLGRYRLRYDMLRCGGENSAEDMSKILDALSPAALDALLQQHPELVKKSVRQVMDFDKKYPARNNPDTVCKIVEALEQNANVRVQPEHWEKIRQALRSGTEAALRTMK